MLQHNQIVKARQWWANPTHLCSLRGSLTPQSPDNQATLSQGCDQRSRIVREWIKMARHKKLKAGQSSTRRKVSCDSKPKVLHKEVLAQLILWKHLAKKCCVLCSENESIANGVRVSPSENTIGISH